MGIFDNRIAYKPVEYPDVLEFREAIKKSRWDVEEFNLDRDAFQFQIQLSPIEQAVIRKTVLAVSQIEAMGVKTFWAKLLNIIPKHEIVEVALTFAENEIVHAEAYSKILSKLGLEDEFTRLLQVPVIAGRADYLSKYLKNVADNVKQAYTLNLALFSMFIENVSLFSQFAIIKSFTEKKNCLKEIDSIIDATMKEETIHAKFGMYLINLIKQEYPEWFNEDFYNKIYRACNKAFKAELDIIEWIFEEGEIDTVSKAAVIEFIKDRFNQSLKEIGAVEIFDVDQVVIQELDWMKVNLLAYIRNDFFDTQSTNYTKFNKSFSEEDIFED